MTEISTPPPIPENDDTTPAPASPWVMLITMLLLISGLILSSAMLLHYAMDGKEGEAGNPASGFARLLEERKKLSVKVPTAGKQGASENQPSEPTAANPSDSSIMKSFFGGGDDGTVRWPKLEVTGFGQSADAVSSFAIINGKHVLVDTYIGEVRLVEILPQGAVVEYQGEQKVVTIGDDH